MLGLASPCYKVKFQSFVIEYNVKYQSFVTEFKMNLFKMNCNTSIFVLSRYFQHYYNTNNLRMSSAMADVPPTMSL